MGDPFGSDPPSSCPCSISPSPTREILTAAAAWTVGFALRLPLFYLANSSTSTPIISHRCSRPSFNYSQKSTSTRVRSFCSESSWNTQERATKRYGPLRRTQNLLACGGSRSGGQRWTWWSLWGTGTTSSRSTRTPSRRTPVLDRVAHPPSPCAILRRAQESNREDHPRR